MSTETRFAVVAKDEVVVRTRTNGVEVKRVRNEARASMRVSRPARIHAFQIQQH